eukprot:1056309-Prymnesium_polylepis.2
MSVTDRMRGDETEDILEALDLLDHVALAVQQITLAQKASPKERASFATVSTSEALALGRKCTIGLAQWDYSKPKVV